MYLDIAILVIIVISALAGLTKGIFRTLVEFLGGFVTLVVTILITGTVADKLLTVDFFNSFAFNGAVSLKYLFMGVMPDEFALVSITADSSVIEGFIAQTFLKPFVAPILSYIGSASYVKPDMMLNEAVSIICAHYLFIFLTGVAVFIVIRILVALLSVGFDAAAKNATVKAANRLLGFIFGIVRGVVVVAVIFFVMPVFSSFSFMSEVDKQINDSTVAKIVAEETAKISNDYFNKSDDLLRDILRKMGLLSGNETEMGENERALHLALTDSTQDMIVKLNSIKDSVGDEDFNDALALIESIVNESKAVLAAGAPDGTDFVALTNDTATLAASQTTIVGLVATYLEDGTGLSDIEQEMTAVINALANFAIFAGATDAD